MKVFISADIEGVTGMVAWSQCGRPNSEHFDFRWAREMMTHDINAAIRGCRAAGATEIVVKDSHGNSKNLLVSDLEDGVSLVSGTGSHVDGMMTGIDDSFDACMLVGYHGMAGTLHGIMEHTISGQVHRMWLNGMPAGEIAMSTGLAGHYGVPLVMVEIWVSRQPPRMALVTPFQPEPKRNPLPKGRSHTNVRVLLNFWL